PLRPGLDAHSIPNLIWHSGSISGYDGGVVTARATAAAEDCPQQEATMSNHADDRIPVEIDPADDRPIEPLPLRADPAAVMPFTQELTLESDSGPAPAQKETEATIWHVPFAPSPHFTGRDQILADLHASLRKSDPLARTQALVGMAG